MKKTIWASLLVLAMNGAALADAIKLDEAYAKTNQWLSDQHLSITGNGAQRDDASAFSQETLLFYGEAAGNPAHTSPAQREMMAKRAAETIAKRAVVEYLQGFSLSGNTSAKALRSSVEGVVKDVQVVASEYSPEKDTAVCIVKIGMRGPKGFASTLYDRMLSDANLMKELATNRPNFTAKPLVATDVYDGLVIDASQQEFKPALINRIFNEKNEVLYDPSKLEKKLLVEQGCGEYANSVEKAKEALARRGVKNPLVITAAGTAGSSDLKVSEADAVRIFSANQGGAFFGSAKVAFVLR